MTIKLLCIGKTDNRELKQLIEVYKNRLQFYNKFEIDIIPDLKKTKSLDENQQKEKEGELILAKVQNSDFLVLLDENGKEFSSEKFSAYIQKRLNSGLKQLIFVIGGPYGFSEAVYQRADSKVALSQMTFSHQMVRLFFTEQLYRAFTILKNEPYHHR
ncbi:23S rRNA (pseudouridine(1915)-N(3))-methyltransferase RlmH [Salegentibacter salarius]|uniref:Ribosomal RNA large subunit methyltransferase H n=1 Tax=Salegentibacter salarius TaxID=435906 RepID=A0A2N0U182_9FLAO|nr:23S rRNA (pseudouridine(1915)-N(3))-methyltransferase RlmH [Salegentibacter salarius]OEY73592.1 23S rRNA (pseudouridine(1915)-N(3))-methyltransferase RlmH [Salegentibacter salarius]PKD20762.1 50S rRNA methyltransferase [Salegentibacter salarius]SLJ95395.1 23S rRNA (pseudouridine1915-N3)-methyltransferase [Salegentibacter salarius]